jgi:hypothetical protein
MGAALDALMTMVRVPSNFPIILIGSCKDDLKKHAGMQYQGNNNLRCFSFIFHGSKTHSSSRPVSGGLPFPVAPP